jgi:hypothetical protein
MRVSLYDLFQVVGGGWGYFFVVSNNNIFNKKTKQDAGYFFKPNKKEWRDEINNNHILSLDM